MIAGRIRMLAAVAMLATLALAGCGDPEQDAAGAQAPGAAATATAGDPTTPTTSAPTTSAPAITAPASTAVTVVPAAGDDEPTGQTGADTGVAAEPMTADEFYADLGPETVELFGGEACARELSEIAAAAMRFEAREGREPDDLDELAGDLPTAPVLWAFDADREELVPAPGSPCPDLASATEQDPTDACEAGRKTLEVAREAYLAMIGEGTEPTEADLVAAGLLREELDDWDLAGGVPVPQPGSPCG